MRWMASQTMAPPPTTNGPPMVSGMSRKERALSAFLGSSKAPTNAPPPRMPVHSPDGTRIRRPTVRSAAVPAALWRGLNSDWDMRLLPQFHIQSAAVEKIVRVERDDLAF